MTTSNTKHRFTLSPEDNNRLAALCGELDGNLQYIEKQLGVEINNRGFDFFIIGIPKSVELGCILIKQLYQETATSTTINPQDIQLMIKSLENNVLHKEDSKKQDGKNAAQQIIKINKIHIKSRTQNQNHYIKSMTEYDINFGIGPSGTGKTFLAVAYASQMLEKEQVKRLVLVRPAVEAGEKLGFLPGDLSQKVDPYLRPLYDALYFTLGTEKVAKLIENNIIEVAPLAFMRGRTLNDSFIILDESQNTTIEQMKMFLTRIGFGSKAVITGDITQIDLPKHVQSGLRHAITVLENLEDIKFTFFKAEDVVRHSLVQKIIQSYEKFSGIEKV